MMISSRFLSYSLTIGIILFRYTSSLYNYSLEIIRIVKLIVNHGKSLTSNFIINSLVNLIDYFFPVSVPRL